MCGNARGSPRSLAVKRGVHRGGSWVGRGLKTALSQIRVRGFWTQIHVRGFCIKRRALALRRVRQREGIPSGPRVEVRTSTRGFSGGRLTPHPTPLQVVRAVGRRSSFSSGGLKTMLAWPPTTQRARGCRGFDGFRRRLTGLSGKRDREVSPTSGGAYWGVFLTRYLLSGSS